VEGDVAGTWANWCGNQTATGIDVRRPRNQADVAEIVDECARDGRRVRPVGAGHSFTGVARPESVAIQLDHLADIIGLDCASGLVTVGAGMPLYRLNLLLAAEGLACTNLGDIDRQTVAGALATGTHGTGLRFGGLATQVRGLDLVLADGTAVSCSETENPKLFEAARVSLGALGVVTAVTLQAVPLFALRAQEGPMPLDDVLDGFAEVIERPDHAEFYWFPHTRLALVKRNTRVPLADGLRPLRPFRRWLDDEFLSNTVFGAAVDATRRFPGLVRPLAGVTSRALGARTYTDLSYAVFTSPRRVKFVEMEYAIPRAAMVDTFREMVATFERSGLRVAIPVEVRVAAADDIPLSTANGRDSGYIAVHMSNRSAYEAYFRLVEPIMLAAGGRPHWGKLHTLDAAALRSRYPRFDDFLAIRDAVDPTGMFANAYLDRVLGCPPGARS
jgi:L-gulono-1,4-lactone dehydrogenase